jgi:serine/threonine protein kinase
MILEQLDHPFIVKLYSAFQDARNLYMNLEFVVGGELFTFLSTYQNFTVDIARFFAAEIVCVLEYLHARKIVYRDLKPENVLIDQHGHIKICDFGFAKHLQDRTYTVCGTMDYLSPEIIKKRGHGFGVDFWALGVIIFEMITGYPPFDDDNPIGVCSKILNGDVTFPDFLDDDTVSIIRGLLTEDLTQRLGCMEGKFRDLMLHPFFASVDWNKCYQRKLRPPFRPNITGLEDTQNFPEYDEVDLTTLEAVDTALTADQQKLFDEFSRVNDIPEQPAPAPPDFSIGAAASAAIAAAQTGVAN